MRRAALIALGTATILAALVAPQAGRAHLLPSGSGTLLGMMAAADGMLVARAAAATHVRDPDSAATPFLARETVAGMAPTGGFVLDQQAPILRYAELQDALLLVARRQDEGGAARWVSVQPAGAAILLDAGAPGEATRAVLRRLWQVAHAKPGAASDGAAAVAALLAALALPEAKLRALAFLDLSGLAGDREHFSAATVARLASYGDQPGDDAQLAPAVRDLGRKLSSPATGAGPSAPPTGDRP